MTRLLTILFSLCGLHAYSTTYYVGAGGNDASAGTSAGTRWLTLSKVSGSTFSSGDSVLFNRGETFAGSLTPKNGVIYSAYGTGNTPNISGFTTLSSWTSLGGNLYRATLNSGTRLNVLTVDGVIIAPGRYPNHNPTDGGYLTVTAHTPTSAPFQNVTSTVTVSGITGSWTGGEIVVRKNSYTFDRAAISNHTGTTLTYISPSANEQINGFGIFVQNHLSTLDQTNEWYYNPSANTLTIYGNPAGKVVKASTVSTIVDLNNKSNVKFINLAFEGSDTSTFHIYGGSATNSIIGCDLTYNFEAISTFDGESQSGLLLENCNIRQTASSAIQMFGTSSSTFRNDSVLYSNMLPGIPRPVQSNGYNTCFIQGSNNLTEYCEFIHSGGPSVGFNGGNNNIVQYNLIQNFCNIIGDFGGVYTNGGGSGNIIRGNIVLDGVGGYLGTPYPFPHAANGIYLDEGASNVLVERNTISRMSSNGVYIHVSNTNTIRNNTISDCRDAMISQSDDQYAGSHDNYSNRIVSNTLFAKSITQSLLYANTNLFPASDLWTMATYDSNLLARPYMPHGGYMVNSNGNVLNFYDMPGARAKFGWDNNGTQYQGIAPFRVTGTVGSNLFSNSTITSTSGFRAYAPLVASTEANLDGTALKITGSPSTDSTTMQGFEIRFGAIPSGKTYRLSFSVIGSTNKENLRAYWIDDPNHYNRFSYEAYIPIRTTRMEDTIYVTTNSAKSNMSLVLFASPSYTPVWFDNVILQEVTGSVVNIDDSVRHEYNATPAAVDRVLGNNYRSLAGVAYTGRAYIGPYSSLILKREINASPDANAGSNVMLTLPVNYTTLNGSGSTDADGTISAWKWSQISGPNTASFSSTVIASPIVSAMIAGTYSFQLRVTDNAGFQDSALVQVLVSSAANQLPTANAGPDQTKTLPTATATLAGSGSDPDGTISSYAWTQTTGPNTAIISNITIAAPTISGMIAGTYVFRLTVTDNSGGTAMDDMTITVNSAGNQAPTANAGGDKTIELPIDSVQLVGLGSDADGTITSYQWVKISGPVSYTISTPTMATTWLKGLVEGMYTFRLTVTDNMGATHYDDINVTVMLVYAPSTGEVRTNRVIKVIAQ